MKSSKKIKIILICVILLVTTLVAITFYARQKFNPESLKAELITSLGELYPNLKIDLGNLEVGFGINSHIKISKVKLSSKVLELNKARLGSFDLIDVKIPVFNILTGGGTIVLEVKNPEIEFRSIEKGSNWSKTLESPVKEEIDQSKKSKLPAFLSNSQINAYMQNLLFIHAGAEGKINKYNFNEISLKDIGIKRPMAIKLSSNVEFAGTELIKFSIDSIGEFSLKSFLEDRVVRTKAISKISNLSLGEKNLEIGEVSLNKKILFIKTGRITYEISSENLLESKGEYLILKDEGTLKIEKLLLSLEGLNKVYPFKTPGLNLSDSSVNVDGEVVISKEGYIKPFLKAKMVKSLFYEVDPIKLELERGVLVLTENKFDLSAAFSTLKGRGELKLKNELDLNKKLDLSGLDPFSASLDLNGLIFEESLLRKLMEPKTENIKAKVEAKKVSPIIPFILDLELKNIVLLKEVLNGNTQISAVKDKIAIKNLDLKLAGGRLLVNSTTELLKETSAHKFSIDLEKVNLKTFRNIAPKSMPFATGLLNGSIAGNAKSTGKGMSYSVFLKGHAEDGEIINYDFSEVINERLDKINQLPYFNKKPLKKVKIPQDYEKVTYDFHIKEDVVKIKKIHMIGIKKKIELKSEGQLKANGPSDVYINFFDKKKNYLKFLAEVDMNSFPTRMTGTGYDLKPDYNYTMKVFLKKAEKRVKKKAKAAVKKVIKKETNKLKEKAKSKAKDLIKDLFQ
jgi:hypothetical protein